MHYLAIDVGTSSTKASVWQADGTSIHALSFSVDHAPHRSDTGESTFDVTRWQEEILLCLDEVHERVSGAGVVIAGVGSCTFWHSCLGVDQEYLPITSLFTWADTRPEEFECALRSEYLAINGHSLTGCPLHSSFYPMRLRWHAKAFPDVHKKVYRWLSPGEWLLYWLTRAKTSSVSMASATGLFDTQKCDWSSDALSLAGITLDQVQPVNQTVGAFQLHEGFRKRWPSFATAPWALSIGDGAAGNVGSGCLRTGMAAINLGTSGAIRLAADKDATPIAGLWRYRVDARTPLLGAAFSDGGDAVRWVSERFRFDDFQESLAEIMARPRGVHNLTVLPYLTGERCPGWRTGASGTIDGLKTTTQPIDVLQAVMESVVLQFAAALDRMATVGVVPTEIIASGGGFKVKGWAEMLADALGRDIQLADEPEMTSRGAAAFGMMAAGHLSSPSALARPVTTMIKPSRDGRQQMQVVLSHQRDLYAREVAGKAAQ